MEPDRLNRTSVGLKPYDCPDVSPSNVGLNRTSVGLKLSLGGEEVQHEEASIEPAWD